MDGPILVAVVVAFLSVDIAVAAWWLRRRRRRPTTWPAPVEPFVPSDEGVQLGQLKTVAALRDSGALSDAEFDAETRRGEAAHPRRLVAD